MFLCLGRDRTSALRLYVTCTYRKQYETVYRSMALHSSDTEGAMRVAETPRQNGLIKLIQIHGRREFLSSFRRNRNISNFRLSPFFTRVNYAMNGSAVVKSVALRCPAEAAEATRTGFCVAHASRNSLSTGTTILFKLGKK